MLKLSTHSKRNVMTLAWKLYKQPYRRSWEPRKFAMCLRQSWQFHRERAYEKSNPTRAKIERRLHVLETRTRWNRPDYRAYTRLQNDLHRFRHKPGPAGTLVSATRGKAWQI